MYLGFPSDSDGKESTCNAGDLGSIPGLGKSSREGHGNPLQCSLLVNPTDRGTWQATVHGGHKESDTTEVTWHACTPLVSQQQSTKAFSHLESL